MKLVLYLILFFPFFLNAQISPDKILEEIKIGVTTKEVKSLLINYDFINRPIHEYGVDSEEMGLLLKQNSENIVFLFRNYNTDTICAIMILSPKILIDGKVRVGDNVEKLLNEYDNLNFELDVVQEEFEYTNLTDSNFRFEFVTKPKNRVCKYVNYKSVEIIDKTKTIDRILLRK